MRFKYICYFYYFYYSQPVRASAKRYRYTFRGAALASAPAGATLPARRVVTRDPAPAGWGPSAASIAVRQDGMEGFSVTFGFVIKFGKRRWRRLLLTGGHALWLTEEEGARGVVYAESHFFYSFSGGRGAK